MSNNLSPLKLTLYGIDNVVKREITRSIVPWGILNRALDLDDRMGDVKFDNAGKPIGISNDEYREILSSLEEFIVFVFDDAVTPLELQKGADIKDMFALYQQVLSMTNRYAPNPTKALEEQKANLQKVRQSRKRH